VRQPKKVYGQMIGMGAKSITIVRAVTADFFFDCRAAACSVVVDQHRVNTSHTINILPVYMGVGKFKHIYRGFSFR
jgi:hypothetical protein